MLLDSLRTPGTHVTDLTDLIDVTDFVGRIGYPNWTASACSSTPPPPRPLSCRAVPERGRTHLGTYVRVASVLHPVRTRSVMRPQFMQEGGRLGGPGRASRIAARSRAALFAYEGASSTCAVGLRSSARRSSGPAPGTRSPGAVRRRTARSAPPAGGRSTGCLGPTSEATPCCVPARSVVLKQPWYALAERGREQRAQWHEVHRPHAPGARPVLAASLASRSTASASGSRSDSRRAGTEACPPPVTSRKGTARGRRPRRLVGGSRSHSDTTDRRSWRRDGRVATAGRWASATTHGWGRWSIGRSPRPP